MLIGVALVRIFFNSPNHRSLWLKCGELAFFVPPYWPRRLSFSLVRCSRIPTLMRFYGISLVTLEAHSRNLKHSNTNQVPRPRAGWGQASNIIERDGLAISRKAPRKIKPETAPGHY